MDNESFETDFTDPTKKAEEIKDKEKQDEDSDNESDLDEFEIDLIKEFKEIKGSDRNLGYFISYPLLLLQSFLSDQSKVCKFASIAVFCTGYIIFTGFALDINFSEGLIPLVCGCLAVGFIAFDWGMEKYEEKIDKLGERCSLGATAQKWISWIFALAALATIITLISIDIFGGEIVKTENLIAVGGFFVYALISIMLSVAPHKINFRPVLWGFGIQFALGAFILRTEVGYEAFNWLSTQMETLLSFADYGALFVFGGESGDISSFAFGVLPIIVYFSMIVSILYYIGFMPYFIGKIAWLMEISCGTSGPETVSCVGNIFVGMTESPLLVRPYLKNLTQSELFCIMVSGMASLAGSVLGAYIKMGISSVDLVTASVLSAPGSIAIAKLMFPEVQQTRFKDMKTAKLEKLEAANIVEAASKGASDSIPLVANIAAMLIAFTSIIYWLNSALAWMGECVGFDNWSFDLLLSYFFYPFTIILGFPMNEVLPASELVGQKTFFTEFVAYQSLSDMITYRKDGYPRCDCDGDVQWFSSRTEQLVTYALSGFSSIPSLAIMIGGLSALCPSRRPIISKLISRALIGAIISCMVRGCVASILYEPSGRQFFWGQTDINGCDFDSTGCDVICGDTIVNGTFDCSIYDSIKSRRKLESVIWFQI